MFSAVKHFFAAFISTKFPTKITTTALVATLFFLPGQNDYQLLALQPQAPQVKGVDIVLPTPAPYPVLSGQPAPSLSAKGVIVVDADSAAILYQKNPDSLLLPASTTKIMTALVALEAFNLDDLVTINQASQSIGHSMHLQKGEKISVKNLLYGILVESGNDAAFALSQHYPGGYSAFIKAMNQKAQDLNLVSTHFRNVSGVEQYNHLTTVRDLSILARYALLNPLFASMVSTKTITVANHDGSIIHELNNINALLGKVEGIKGVKTGWTENAGECLVSYTERNVNGKLQKIITVILGSQDRFGETETLINWAFANHSWEEY